MFCASKHGALLNKIPCLRVELSVARAAFLAKHSKRNQLLQNGTSLVKKFPTVCAIFRSEENDCEKDLRQGCLIFLVFERLSCTWSEDVHSSLGEKGNREFKLGDVHREYVYFTSKD